MAPKNHEREVFIAARAEMKELFRPVEIWRNFAPAERLSEGHLYLFVQSILIDLAFLGWSVEIIRNGRGWTVRIRKRCSGKTLLTASGTSDSYLDAVHQLYQSMLKMIDRLISPNELKIAA